MIYVFDTGVLFHLFKSYYPSRFPSLWTNFNKSVESGHIVSCREVFNEIDGTNNKNDPLLVWAKNNKDFFQLPANEELMFVARIFSVAHFQSLIRAQETLKGKPVADPFIIAKAQILKGCVVTQESKHKPNSSRIPNICKYFNVKCCDLEDFMEQENWSF